jgi:methionyl aminopeptidase
MTTVFGRVFASRLSVPVRRGPFPVPRVTSTTVPSSIAWIRLKSTASDSLSETEDDTIISPSTVPWVVPPRTPVIPHPVVDAPRRTVPDSIVQPLYAGTGDTVSRKNRYGDPSIPIYDKTKDQEFLDHMRHAAQIAATVLQDACDFCRSIGTPKTTLDVDALVHYRLIELGAYPSPLNYAGFPRSVCTSVNEVICHGIPDGRVLQYGDLVSIDVSCYVHQVHGDNCATVLVGDIEDGAPRRRFATAACRDHFGRARRLRDATQEALYAAIAEVRPGQPLSNIGTACHDVADRHGLSSVSKYRGHGIGTEFHTPPFIQHTRPHPIDQGEPPVILQEGMIFTIEPMFCEGTADCYEWESDRWSVATVDGGWAAQFEHAVLVTAAGAEILTLPLGHPDIGQDYRADRANDK